MNDLKDSNVKWRMEIHFQIEHMVWFNLDFND